MKEPPKQAIARKLIDNQNYNADTYRYEILCNSGVSTAEA
jgi:hypothetical protein